jgi:hypothetical protein
MKRLTWIGLPLLLGLLLLAGLSGWPQVATSAHAATTPVTGTWQVVPSPTIDVSNSTFGARLNAVAVVSSTDIWAVGFGPLPGGAAFVKQTLIEHWNGSKWSVVPSPNPPAKFTNVELDGVFALSSTNVWAVGFFENPSVIGRFTLIEHWNGSSWALVSSPNPDPEQNELHSIAGVASNDLWAVGGRGDGNTGSPFQSLIEHWNGTSWSVVSNPGVNTLFGVTALAANNVWAVAFHTNPNVSDIIEHWNGTSWSNVSAPSMNVNGGFISLRGVAAISATDIWAVGNQQNPLTNAGSTITEHWNGSAWSISSSFSRNSVLTSVAAPGSADVWAVDGSGLMQTQHWDGSAWSIIATPNPPVGSGLNGVAAVSSGNLWAVGWNDDSNGHFTPLIEHFSQG